MPVTVVQSNSHEGAGGSAWDASFLADTTPGNTLFLAVFSYSTAGLSQSSDAPVYDGAACPTAVKLIDKLSSAATDNVYCALWMFPDIAAAAKTLGATSVDAAAIDTNVGWACFEVAGLGAAPVLDKSASGGATGGDATSGSSGATAAAPEFVIGASVIFAVGQDAAAGYTNLFNKSGGFCEAGYQIAGSAGSSFDYATNTGLTADWSAIIATVRAAAAPPAAAGAGHAHVVALTAAGVL